MMTPCPKMEEPSPFRSKVMTSEQTESRRESCRGPPPDRPLHALPSRQSALRESTADPQSRVEMLQVRWNLKPSSPKDKKTLAASFNPINERLKAHRDFDIHAHEVTHRRKRQALGISKASLHPLAVLAPTTPPSNRPELSDDRRWPDVSPTSSSSSPPSAPTSPARSPKEAGVGVAPPCHFILSEKDVLASASSFDLAVIENNHMLPSMQSPTGFKSISPGVTSSGDDESINLMDVLNQLDPANAVELFSDAEKDVADHFTDEDDTAAKVADKYTEGAEFNDA